MGTDDEFARWAALFLSSQEVQPETIAHSVPLDDRITAAAHALLDSVDAGGVPAFMTSPLKQIALDNGVALSPATTPNDIIAALRARLSPN